jgi:hypothetical protein
MTKTVLRAALIASFGVLLSGTASFATGWENREVTIVNDTNEDIVWFYGSRTTTSDWEEDILGSDILPAGSSILIDFDDGTGACTFDFRAVYADGDEDYAMNQNVCRISVYTFN